MSAFWKEVIRLCELHKIKEARIRENLGGVKSSTFATWKERDRFPRSLIPGLNQVLKWKELDEDVAERMGVTLLNAHKVAKRHSREDTFDKSMRSLSSKYDKVLKHFELYAGNSVRIFNSLGHDCIFAFSSCTTNPYEFDSKVYEDDKHGKAQGREIGLAIAKALLQGALCLYIRPTQQGVEYYQQNLGDTRLVFHHESLRQIEDFRKRMKRIMLTSGIEPDISESKADQILFENLDQCYIDSSHMWMPGLGLSMVGQPKGFKLRRRMILSLPGAMFGGALVCPEYDTLEHRFTYFLNSVVQNACEELRAMREGTTTGRISLNIPVDRLELAERFYTRYSEILRTVSNY